MATPQMMALDQALAEAEVPQPGDRFPKLAAVAGDFIAIVTDGLTARAGQP